MVPTGDLGSLTHHASEGVNMLWDSEQEFPAHQDNNILCWWLPLQTFPLWICFCPHMLCGMKLICSPICKTQTHCNMYIYMWRIYFNHHCVYLYIFIYLCTTCLMKLLNVWDQVAQDPTGMQLLAAVSVLTPYSDRAYLLSWYILLLMLDVSFCVDCLHLARFASTMQLLFVLKLHTLDVP